MKYQPSRLVLGGARIAAALFLFGVLHLVGLAQPALPPSGATGGEVSYKVKHFLVQAESANRREIQAAQLAVQQAASPAVRDYAQSALSDHQQMAGDLKPLLSARMIKLDNSDGNSLQLRLLTEKTGQDFDQTFVKIMVAEHNDALDLYESAAKNNDDPLVQSFASQYVAKLNQHLVAAKMLKQEIH